MNKEQAKEIAELMKNYHIIERKLNEFNSIISKSLKKIAKSNKEKMLEWNISFPNHAIYLACGRISFFLKPEELIDE